MIADMQAVTATKIDSRARTVDYASIGLTGPEMRECIFAASENMITTGWSRILQMNRKELNRKIAAVRRWQATVQKIDGNRPDSEAAKSVRSLLEALELL